jgi:hypothetical protein
MFHTIFPVQNDPAYKKGIDIGVEIAESHFKKMLNDLYKKVKKGELKRQSHTMTASSNPHYCNCDYCEIDEKTLKKF